MIRKPFLVAPLAIALAGPSVSAAAFAAMTDKTWQLSFWINGEVEGVTEADVFTHPCGATVLLAVSSIPIGRPNIDTDQVVEFDAAGRIVREWRTPVDSPPVAVDGETLVVSDWIEGKPRSLAILPSGQIDDFATPSAAPPEGAELQCPSAVVSHFGDSDYLRCERWTDRSSGTERLMAYEGPCT